MNHFLLIPLRHLFLLAVAACLLLAACGGDEDSPPPQPNPQPQPTDTLGQACYENPIRFKTHVQPVLASNCLVCHNAQLALGDLMLEDHDQVERAVRERNLLASVRHEPGAIPMPSSVLKIDSCSIQKIADWVAVGMPDN